MGEVCDWGADSRLKENKSKKIVDRIQSIRNCNGSVEPKEQSAPNQKEDAVSCSSIVCFGGTQRKEIVL